MHKFSNKKVLITGSSSGLGLNLAKIFKEDGNDVFLNGSSERKVYLACKKLNVSGYACDITKENNCIKLINAAEKSLGSIDILICNVGSGTSVEIGKENLKEWKRVCAWNRSLHMGYHPPSGSW